MEFKRDFIFLGIGIFLTLILSYFIIKSFIVPLLFTLLLVYVMNPLYSMLRTYLKSHTLTSLTIIVSFLILILTPFFMMFVQISTEVFSLDSQKVEEGLIEANSYFLHQFNIEVDFLSEYQLFLERLQNFVTTIVFAVPEFLFQIFLIIFFYYYFSREYNFEMLFLRRVFGVKRFEILSLKFKELVDAIIYGQILVRLMQSFIGLIGFLLIGVESAFLWAFIMFFVSFLPLVGTSLVWLPIAVVMLIQGDYTSSLLILVLGIFISSIDNLLLPYLISGKTRVGPVLILISILGGIEVFGIYGLLLGPFILGALFVLFEELYSDIANKNPRIRKFVWSEKEREKFRNLNSKISRDQYVQNLNKKYENLARENKVI